MGTGTTAVQAIPEIAQQAKHLTVFQCTAEEREREFDRTWDAGGFALA